MEVEKKRNYENGELIYEYHTDQFGRLHGAFKRYHVDTGKLAYECFYVEGNLHGLSIFYANNKVTAYHLHVNGEMVNLKEEHDMDMFNLTKNEILTLTILYGFDH